MLERNCFDQGGKKIMENRKLDAIIEEAKKDNRKGNYGVYENYKQRIYDVATHCAEISDGCKRLADALKV